MATGVERDTEVAMGHSRKTTPAHTTAQDAPPSLTRWRETWRQLQRSAGPHATAFKRSVYVLMLAAVLQGLALACMLPIFEALLPPMGNQHGCCRLVRGNTLARGGHAFDADGAGAALVSAGF